ncbi:hypothetical protein Patl1_01642 [Pistacia atlantica]|uniref:Uncharacterized protein n=1 Tax=Pistacia atlantica TaxID=434234 RepID=A0ACC1C860_9ROSI|nr:hypothetical protein Patl1_01642 [Pistacia atlantica]
MCKPPVTESIFNKFQVFILNNFQNNTLEAHCKSRDDDLGLRHLPVHGEFNWKFRMNLKASTLYFCNLWWTGGHLAFDAFKVDEKFLFEFCSISYCRWKAQEDGIYVYSVKHKQYMFMYKWGH